MQKASEFHSSSYNKNYVFIWRSGEYMIHIKDIFKKKYLRVFLTSQSVFHPANKKIMVDSQLLSIVILKSNFFF